MFPTDSDPPGRVLRTQTADWMEAPQHLRGFGGLHGGLALALLAVATQPYAPGMKLQSLSGRFDRPIESGFQISSSLTRSGKTTVTAAARAESPKGLHIDASAIYAAQGGSRWPVLGPEAPKAPPPEDCDVFEIPRDFVPIAAAMEIRPVGSSRPYGGGPDPELTAWVRLVEDDSPPDVPRLVFLMDALAPSYTAMLSTLVLVPTVQLTVRPTPALATASSPWLLLRARTPAASADGWVDEYIDAWGPDGSHLGSARQLRVVRGG